MGEDAFSIEDFDTFGATTRTLRQFIGACADLNAIVRDQMIPNPD
jgi:transaldolase